MLPIGSELSVPRSFYLHKGAYLGEGRVLHNHSERGEEVVTLDQFADGGAITVTQYGVEDVAAFLARVAETLANPSRYDFIINNCDHTVNRLRTAYGANIRTIRMILLSDNILGVCSFDVLCSTTVPSAGDYPRRLA